MPSAVAPEGFGFPVKPMPFVPTLCRWFGYTRAYKWHWESVIHFCNGYFNNTDTFFFMSFIMIMIILACFLLNFPSPSIAQIEEKFIFQKPNENSAVTFARNKMEISDKYILNSEAQKANK